MLSASGIVAGVVLGASTFSPPLRTKLASLNIYILIAGMAIIFVSIQSLVRDFTASRPPKP